MTGRQSAAYQTLAALGVGEVVPDDLYILGYLDGTVPEWVVVEIEDLGGGGLRLVLEDIHNGAKRVRVDVLTWPGTTLYGPPYMAGDIPGPMLTDLDQQGRCDRRRGAGCSR